MAVSPTHLLLTGYRRYFPFHYRSTHSSTCVEWRWKTSGVGTSWKVGRLNSERLPSPPLRCREVPPPLNPVRGSGERCKLPQKILNLVHIKASGGINFNEYSWETTYQISFILNETSIISAICSLWPKSGTAKCITSRPTLKSGTARAVPLRYVPTPLNKIYVEPELQWKRSRPWTGKR